MRILYITLGGSEIRGGIKLFLDISRTLLNKYKDIHNITIINAYRGREKIEKSIKKVYEELYGINLDNIPLNIINLKMLHNTNSIFEIVKMLPEIIVLSSNCCTREFLSEFLLSNFLSNVRVNTVFLLLKRLMSLYDIVHVAPWYTAYAVGSVSISKLLNSKTRVFLYPLLHPYLYAPGEHDFLEKIIDPHKACFLKLKFYKHVLSSFDAITVSTPYEKNVFKKFNNNTLFVGEGIDLEYVNKILYKIRNSYLDFEHHYDIIITYIGGKTYGKGYYHLLKALYKMSENSGIRICLVVAGGKPYGYKINEILSLEKKLYKEKLLINLGLIDEETKYKVIQLSDIVVLPSAFETVPLVFLEAWALGKPVIGSRIPTLQSVIRYEGDGGFLIPFGDVESLICLLTRIARGEYDLKTIGMKGKKKVYENYNLSKVAKRLYKAYKMMKK